MAGLPWINIPGRTAVWIFFGISGYVIGYGFLHKRYALTGEGLRNFYVNRFLRIYPLFLLMSLLGWFTVWSETGTNPVDWTDVPSQFFALQFNQEYLLNGVFWTLGVELHFYLIAPILVLPILLKDVSKRRWTAAACYIGMLVFLSYAVRIMGWSPDGRNIVATLPHFFTGMVGCSIVVSMKPNVRRAWGYLCGAPVLLLLTNWLYHRDPEIFWGLRGILLVDAMILLFILAHSSFGEGKKSTSHLTIGFAWVGTLSYGIYAWHAYLLTHVAWLSDHTVLLVLASITFAYLSYKLIELPALRFKQRQSPGDDLGNRLQSLP